jgi:hypothetical protein
MGVARFKRFAANNDQEFDGYKSDARESACAAGASLAAKGMLLSVRVQLQSNAAADEWLFIVDKAGALAGADVPIHPPIRLSPGQAVDINFEPDALRFDVGLKIAMSTSDTFAASATNKALFLVKFARS